MPAQEASSLLYISVSIPTKKSLYLVPQRWWESMLSKWCQRQLPLISSCKMSLERLAVTVLLCLHCLPATLVRIKSLPVTMCTQICGCTNCAHHCMLILASLPCVPVMRPLRIGCAIGFRKGLRKFVLFLALLWRTRAYTGSVSYITPKSRLD